MAQTILIIEDSPFIQKVYKDNFEKEGFKVIATNDGIEGFDAAKMHHPDIILLDIVMPKLGGLGTLAKLKSDDNTIKIPVVILTGAEREDEKKEAIDAGAVDYINKSSTSPEDMLYRIKQIIG